MKLSDLGYMQSIKNDLENMDKFMKNPKIAGNVKKWNELRSIFPDKTDDEITDMVRKEIAMI